MSDLVDQPLEAAHSEHRFVGYEQLSVLVIFEKKPSS